MAALDVEKLLRPVKDEAPAGEDLAYDTAYLELLRKAEGTPEQQVGETIIPAEDPDWREVHDQCLSLLGRTKDLRLLILLLVSSLQTRGLPGLRDAIALLRQTIEQHWEALYPRLDPDDNNDPLERLNIVGALAAPPEAVGDPLKIQKRLRETPLTNSRAMGRFSLRHLALASGEAQPRGEEAVPESAIIEAAFDDTPLEDLQTIGDAISGAVDEFRALDSKLEAAVGAGRMPDLAPFQKCLSEVRTVVARALARRGVGSAVDGATPNGSGAHAGGVSAPGEIRSHQDVLLALDRICQYYERAEPSSPVPLLLQRAKRLVSRNFVDILSDLSPDSMAQFKLIAGIE
ncbi:MAG: type VI secretion system protein TssA [Phycisphaerales bacterium]